MVFPSLLFQLKQILDIFFRNPHKIQDAIEPEGAQRLLCTLFHHRFCPKSNAETSNTKHLQIICAITYSNHLLQVNTFFQGEFLNQFSFSVGINDLSTNPSS